MRQNAFAAGAPLRTLLGEITALLQTLQLDLGDGKKEGGMKMAMGGEGREGEGKKGEGMGEAGKRLEFRGDLWEGNGEEEWKRGGKGMEGKDGKGEREWNLGGVCVIGFMGDRRPCTVLPTTQRTATLISH